MEVIFSGCVVLLMNYILIRTCKIVGTPAEYCYLYYVRISAAHPELNCSHELHKFRLFKKVILCHISWSRCKCLKKNSRGSQRTSAETLNKDRSGPQAGRARLIGMALVSMVKYETHMIYKHFNTCIQPETMFHMKHNTFMISKSCFQ